MLTTKHWIVLGGLILLLVFGRSVETAPSDSGLLVQREQSVATLEKPRQGSLLSAASPRSEVIRLDNAAPGQVYRLVYLLKDLTTDQPEEGSTSTIRVMYEPKFAIPILLTEHQFADVPTDGQYYESLFTTTAGPGTVSIYLDTSNQDELLGVIFARSTLLATNSITEAVALPKTEFGSLQREAIFDSGTANDDYQYSLLRRSAVVGQVFSLDKPQVISEVEVSLSVKGNGGVGDYQVIIGKVGGDEGSETRGEIIFTKNMTISQIREYQSPEDERLHQIPIGGFFETGKYFVAIDANGVSLSVRHHLQINGEQKPQSSDARAITFRNDDIKFLPTTFHLRIFGVTAPSRLGVSLPGGATVEELGKGKALYIYRFRNNLEDYLDYLISLDDPTISKASYNGATHGIVDMTGEESSPIILSFSFPYQAEQISISGLLVGSWISNGLQYSVDGTTWRVLSNHAFTDTGDSQLKANVSGERAKQLFLKLDPALAGQQLSGQEYGIRELVVEAELRR